MWIVSYYLSDTFDGPKNTVSVIKSIVSLQCNNAGKVDGTYISFLIYLFRRIAYRIAYCISNNIIE